MTEHDDYFEARPWLFTRLDGTVVVLGSGPIDVMRWI